MFIDSGFFLKTLHAFFYWGGNFLYFCNVRFFILISYLFVTLVADFFPHFVCLLVLFMLFFDMYLNLLIFSFMIFCMVRKTFLDQKKKKV